MYAGFLNKLKPRLPLLCQMHQPVLCRSGHLLRIRPDLGFDSKITGRYAARVAELESRGHPPKSTQGQHPAVALLCLGGGAPFPQVRRPC